MSTPNYDFPEINPAALFDGANDINKLANAIDSQMKQVEILGKDSQFTLQPATRVKLGGVRIGANVNVSADGTISTDIDPYVLPPASSTTLGGVSVPADSGINLTPDGTISIDDKSVTLPVNSVTTAQLQDKCVTGTKIADDAVTYEKLSPALQSQIESSGKYARGGYTDISSKFTYSFGNSTNLKIYQWGPLVTFDFRNVPLEIPSGNSNTSFELGQAVRDVRFSGNCYNQPLVDVLLSGEHSDTAQVTVNPQQWIFYVTFDTAPGVGNYTLNGAATFVFGV